MSLAPYACPACGFRVHDSRWGSGAACPVCGWLDDFEQLVHPDLTYGANRGASLRQAQARWLERSGSGRAVFATFDRDPCWRPLRPGETPAADPDGPSSPVCYVATPDTAEFEPYWLR